MRVGAAERHRAGIGREALPLELAAGAAVHRVGARRAETGYVEVLGAASHFLVGREGDADRPVRDLRMRQQIRGGRDDLGHAGFVIGAEQRGARRGDDVVAVALRQIWRVGLTQHHAGHVGQHEIAAVVGAVDDRPHAGAAHLGRGVDVGDEADDRYVGLCRRGRNGRHHVAVRVDSRVGEAERAQLGDEHVEQDELARRAGIGVRTFARLRVDLHVAEETIEDRLGHAAIMPWFLAILLGLLGLRLALRDYIGHLISPLQTAAVFFLLAFGMIVRWRSDMYRQYRRLVP